MCGPVIPCRHGPSIPIADDDGPRAKDRLGGGLESIPEGRRRLGAGPGGHHGTGQVERHGAMNKCGQPARGKECGEIGEPGHESETATDQRHGAARGAIRRGRSDAGDDDRESEHGRADACEEKPDSRQPEAAMSQSHELGCGECLSDTEVEDEEKDRRIVPRAEDEHRQRRHHEAAERDRARLHRDGRDRMDQPHDQVRLRDERRQGHGTKERDDVGSGELVEDRDREQRRRRREDKDDVEVQRARSTEISPQCRGEQDVERYLDEQRQQVQGRSEASVPGCSRHRPGRRAMRA